MENKIKRIQELVSELNIYRDEYYNQNQSSISDEKYDTLFDELKLLEEESGFVLSNSPTQEVGYEVVSKLQKVNHITTLKSLAKTKSVDELNKWRKNKEILLMLKADGLTVELDYDNGLLYEASTRGNGDIGELVTFNAKQFKNIPLSIPFKGKLRISGEAIIHKHDFDNINSKLVEKDKYATPRNLVSGSVRQLDSKICSKRNVYFYAFNILECNKELSDSKYENFKWLGKQGFWTVFNTKINEITDNIINNMKQLAEEHGIPIDGLVASFDSVDYSNSLEETNHHPLHSVAYKFFDESEQSILQSVEWNTTRSGQVNPTAIFEKVVLDNTEVSRASLFNLTFIEELKLNINCKILVSKRNQIIPYIEENLDVDNGLLEIPDKCPSCGEKTEIRNTGTADFLYCTNDNCSAKLVDKFAHFVKRDCMNIEGLSEAGLQLFVNKGFLKTFDSLYNLEMFEEKIKKFPGWGLKSYNKLIKAINDSRKVKCSNFIYALGISNVGKNSSKIIAKYFNNDFQQFILACKNGFDFSVLTDFGDITSQSIHDWYKNVSEARMWMYLLDEIEIIKDEEKKEMSGMSNNALEGLSICITGSLSKKREEYIKIIEENGGKFINSISKKTNMLLIGDNVGATKINKANDCGTKIVTEDEFIKMIS